MGKPKAKLPDGRGVLKPASNAFDFRIYNMDETGKPDKVYHPHEDIATIVIKTINLVRKMLKEEPVISSFEDLAIGYCRLTPKAWFLQEKQPEAATEKQEPETATNERAKVAAHEFLDPLQIKWPFIVVSNKMKNPTGTAHTGRGPWSGVFNVSEQYIALNGKRLRHMLAAAITTQSSQDKDDLNSQEYRNFEFLFSTAMLHELSHVFFTYLTNGKEFTPSSMRASVATAAPKDKGESGYLMEELVFGGPISFFRDHVVGSPDTSVYSSIDTWSGVPYIRTTTGTYQVRRETIDKTVNGEFEFPFEHNLRNEKFSKLQGMSPYMPPAEESDDIFVHPTWPAFLATPFPYKPE